MPRKILYYPTIDIPNENFLRYAVLYWDKVSTIVPDVLWESRKNDISKEVTYLYNEGVFVPTDPERILLSGDYSESAEMLHSEFTSIIESDEFKHLVGERFFSENTISSLPPDSLAILHRAKASAGIYSFLHDAGLAYFPNDDWVIVEVNAGLIYISLVAKYLADIDRDMTVVGTDIKMYERLNFSRTSRNNGIPVIDFNLLNVLPVPNPDTSFSQILDFKRKRNDELQRFSIELSEFERNISGANTTFELRGITYEFSTRIKSAAEDLEKAMTDQSIMYGLKSVGALISISALAESIISNDVNTPFIPITVGANLIQLLIEYIGNRYQAKNTIRDNAFSYIYYACRQGII